METDNIISKLFLGRGIEKFKILTTIYLKTSEIG